MENNKKSHDEYIEVFRSIFKQTIKHYHLPFRYYCNLETSIRDEMYQNGSVNEKYSLIDAILNRRNKLRRNIVLVGNAGSGKTCYLIRMCELLLEMEIFAIYIPCYDFVFAEYSLEKYFSYLLQDRNNLFLSFYLNDIQPFDAPVILFDGYDEISENERKIFSKIINNFEKKHIQLVITTRETFELDEEELFDYVYKFNFFQYQTLNKYPKYNKGISDVDYEAEFMRNLIVNRRKKTFSKVMYTRLVLNLKSVFQEIYTENKKSIESPEHLLGLIGIYLLDNKKNYFNYCEFRNISCDFSNWQNEKIFETIKKTLINLEVYSYPLNNNVIFFHQQLCNEIVRKYLLICLKERNINSAIASQTFSNDIIEYIVRKVKKNELIEIFKFKDSDHVVSVPCFWFDVLKLKYNFRLQQFEFNNIDFSNSNFSGCKFADFEIKANFHKCIISNISLGNVTRKGIINVICKLSWSDLFATALSDKTIRIWKPDKGCIQILENAKTIMQKLVSCKNYLIGIGIDHKIYVWEKKEKYYKEFKVFCTTSDVLFNCDGSKIIIVQDDCKLIEFTNDFEIFRSCKKMRILSYVWNKDDELLITTTDEFLWIDLKKKKIELRPNKNHIIVNLQLKYVFKDNIFLGYDFNRILIMKKKQTYDFEIYNSYILKDIILDVFYSEVINGFIAVCKNGKIILFDLNLNINSSFRIGKKITASIILNDIICIATNDGIINILSISTEEYLKVIKKYRPSYELNFLGCKFENVQFKGEITSEIIKDNGGIIKYI